MTVTTQPKLRSELLREADAQWIGLLKQISEMHGVGIVLQDASGKKVPVRVNGLGLEAYIGGKWQSLAGQQVSVESSQQSVVGATGVTAASAGDRVIITLPQELGSGSSPTFANVITPGQVDGVDVSAHTHSAASGHGPNIPISSVTGLSAALAHTTGLVYSASAFDIAEMEGHYPDWDYAGVGGETLSVTLAAHETKLMVIACFSGKITTSGNYEVRITAQKSGGSLLTSTIQAIVYNATTYYLGQSLSHVFTDLTPSTEYTVRLQAKCSADTSEGNIMRIGLTAVGLP